MEKGKLIVIDGADGCGKATQTELLVKKLKLLNYAVEQTDFPRYYNNFFGGLVGKLQTDKEIDFSKKDPWLVSILYAADRFESKFQLDTWLGDGKCVVSDRYVSANQLHQGGKIKDPAELEKFLQYLDKMEYDLFCIPRPDIIIYLDVPHQISLHLMQEKKASERKQYSEGKMDTVEQDHAYQLNARESGIKMLQDKTWIRIQCSEDGKTLLSPEAIGQMILVHCLHLLNAS